MKTFRELHIQVKTAHTAKFIAAVDKALNSGWSRKVDDVAEHDAIAGEHVYYVCEPTPSRPRALLAIFRKNDTVLYVSNIVPAEASELSYDEYNAILMDFHDKVLRQLSTDFPVTLIASGDQRRIEEIVSPEAMQKLKQFCGLANKSTGSAHPLDKERWYDFLIQVTNDEQRSRRSICGVGSLRLIGGLQTKPKIWCWSSSLGLDCLPGYVRQPSAQNPLTEAAEIVGFNGRGLRQETSG